ncbi:hypothetical protein D9615_000496 [Tricholomella constricta]|uniref:Uncharacterized protein n=1 Tax=Tricholomella constricta TaxID=117010 RepID=A0A8H5MBB4_9AGAR|nr:hypothetical protein D9615_000496 [Tricholomella constricta]
MFSTLDVDIRPGSGLGRFEIGIINSSPTDKQRRSSASITTGASLWMVLDMLRNLQHSFPQVEVKFDPDASSTTPVIVHLRPHLDLLFSGKHQRLHTICLRKLRDPNPPVTLRYKDTVLSSVGDALTRVIVRRTFGPTYPGDDLRYPGLWFSFEEDGMGEGVKAGHSEDRTQEVKRVLISQKGNDGKSQDALEEVGEVPIMAGDVRQAVVKVHDGVTLYFYPSSSTPVHVRLGETTAQDLTLDLGPPLRVHYKDDERMSIHATEGAPEPENEPRYFYNYFQHGIDFLISGPSHVVTKIILHSNVPGSPLFQRYKRCNWEIEGKPEDDEDGNVLLLSCIIQTRVECLQDTPPRKRFYDRFETISHFLSPREPPPSMHLDRTDEEEDITLPSTATRRKKFSLRCFYSARR